MYSLRKSADPTYNRIQKSKKTDAVLLGFFIPSLKEYSPEIGTLPPVTNGIR